MIGPTGAVRVMVATKPVDFRNYAESIIMRSVRWPNKGSGAASRTCAAVTTLALHII